MSFDLSLGCFAARWLAAKLLGVAASQLPADAADSMLEQLGEGTLPKSAVRPHKFEERTGSMLAAGVILAQASTGARNKSHLVVSILALPTRVT